MSYLDIQEPRMVIGRWLEIEGLPYAYGTFLSATWFTSRAQASKFLGIRRSLLNIPKSIDQTVNTLEGGGLTSGAIDFEIVDVDGLPTSWANQQPNQTTTYYVGNNPVGVDAVLKTDTVIELNSVVGLAINQYLYIGTETVRITAISAPDVTVERAQFRSKAQNFPYHFPVSTVPYVMANRRCWYNQTIDTAAKIPGTFVTSEATLDSERIVRFSGICRGFRLADNEQTTYVLRVESLDRELDRDVFTKIRQVQLLTGTIADASGANGTGTAPGWPGYAAAFADFGVDPEVFTTLGEDVLFKVDDEVLSGRVVDLGYATAIQYTARALLGTRAVEHKAGAIVQELLALTAYNASGTYVERTSKFSSNATASSPLPSNHPLMLILQLLLSTGEGDNWAGGSARNYDVLPEGWGLGIEVSRVNVAEIERFALEEPSITFSGVIEEPQNFVAFMREILKFAGYYFFVALGDLFTIRRLRPPLPDRAVRAITSSELIRKQFSGWDANFMGAVREVVFKYGFDFLTRKHKSILILQLALADIYSKGLARTLEFQTRYLYPGASGIPGDSPFRQFDVNEWLFARADFYETRYGKPPPIVTVRVDYSFMGTEYGDLVYLTETNLPDVADGTRGFTQQICEVIGKSVDDESKTVGLTLLMTGYKIGDYRYISPSAMLVAAHFSYDGGSMVLSTDGVDNANNFVDSAEGSDWAVTLDANESEAAFWKAPLFPEGSSCILWKADFSDYEDGVSVAGGVGEIIIQFASSPGWTPAAGDIITWGRWNQVVPPPQDLFAWAADDFNPPTLDGDVFNKLFPG